MTEPERAELGIDGNYGFALLGLNIQEGEVEFVEIPETDDASEDLPNELSACRTAFERLRARLKRPELSYFFGISHPFGR